MIERYTLPEMGALWSEQTKFQKWLDVEIAVCEVHAEMGGEEVRDRVAIDEPESHVVERERSHDGATIPVRCRATESSFRPLRVAAGPCSFASGP